MGRPPVEWPIPVYVTELRERVVATFRVPTRVLNPLVPAAMAPDVVRGSALISLCLNNGRCLKGQAGSAVLASEFHLLELLTPVRWQAPCRPTTRGQFLLALGSDSDSLSRLFRTALSAEVRATRHEQGTAKEPFLSRGARIDGDRRVEVRLPRAAEEHPWRADSVFDSHEAAEAHLLHPECYFVPETAGNAVQAVPVHQYARSSTHLLPLEVSAVAVAEALGMRVGELELDHVFYQKRCTHTWSFPPERIPVARPLPIYPRGTPGKGLRERVAA